MDFLDKKIEGTFTVFCSFSALTFPIWHFYWRPNRRGVILVSDWGGGPARRLCETRLEKLKPQARRAEGGDGVWFLGRVCKPPPHQLRTLRGAQYALSVGSGAKLRENVVLVHFGA